MIRLKVSRGNFDPLIAMVGRMARPDLSPLAESIRDVMIADNRDGLLAGTDSFGDPMAPVLPSTVRRGRGGDGEPLNPRGISSRAVADYRVRIEDGDNRTLLIGEWPNTPFIHIHASGYVVHARDGDRAVVPRDIVGLRPAGQEQAALALEDFAMTLIGGRP